MELIHEWANAVVCCVRFELQAPASTPEASSATPETGSLQSDDSSAQNSPAHMRLDSLKDDSPLPDDGQAPNVSLATPIQFIGAVLTVVARAVHGAVIVPSMTSTIILGDGTDDNISSLLQVLMDVSADVTYSGGSLGEHELEEGSHHNGQHTATIMCSNGFGVTATFGVACGRAEVWRASLQSAGMLLVQNGPAVDNAMEAAFSNSPPPWSATVMLPSSAETAMPIQHVIGRLRGVDFRRLATSVVLKSALTSRPNVFKSSDSPTAGGGMLSTSGSRSFSCEDLASATGGEAALRALDKLFTSDSPHCVFVVCRILIEPPKGGSNTDQGECSSHRKECIFPLILQTLHKINTIIQLAGGGICDMDTSSADVLSEDGTAHRGTCCIIHCALPQRRHSWRAAATSSGSQDDAGTTKGYGSCSLQSHAHRSAECAFAVHAGIRHLQHKLRSASSRGKFDQHVDDAQIAAFNVAIVAGSAMKVMLKRSYVLVGSEAYFTARDFFLSAEESLMTANCDGMGSSSAGDADEVLCDAAIGHLLDHFRTSMAVTPSADSSFMVIRSQRTNSSTSVATIQRFAELYCRRHQSNLGGAIFGLKDVVANLDRLIGEHVSQPAGQGLFRCAVVVGAPRSAKTSLLLNLAANYALLNTILVDCRMCRSMIGVSSPVEMACPTSPMKGVRHRTAVASTPILCAILLQLKTAYALRGCGFSRSKHTPDVCSALTTVSHVSDGIEALLLERWRCREELLVLLDDVHHAEDDNHTLPILARIARSTGVSICVILTSQKPLIAASGRVSPIPEAMLLGADHTLQPTEICIPSTIPRDAAHVMLRHTIGPRTLQAVVSLLEPVMHRWPSSTSDRFTTPTSQDHANRTESWNTPTPERSPCVPAELPSEHDEPLARLDRLVIEACRGVPFFVSVLGRALRSPEKLMHVISSADDVVARAILEDLLAAQTGVIDLTAEMIGSVHPQQAEWLCHIAVWAAASSHADSSVRRLTMMQLELLLALDHEEEWEAVEERYLSGDEGMSDEASERIVLLRALRDPQSPLGQFVRYDVAERVLVLQPLFVPLALTSLMSKKAVCTAAERLLECTALDLPTPTALWCTLCCKASPPPKKLLQELRVAHVRSTDDALAHATERQVFSVLYAWGVTAAGTLPANAPLAHLSSGYGVPLELAEKLIEWTSFAQFSEHANLLEIRRRKTRKAARNNLAAVYVPTKVADIDVAVEEFMTDAAHLVRCPSGGSEDGLQLQLRVKDSWNIASSSLSALMSVEGTDPQLATAIREVTTVVAAWCSPRPLVISVDPMSTSAMEVSAPPIARLSCLLREMSTTASQIAKDTCTTALSADDRQCASKVGMGKIQCTILNQHITVLLALLQHLSGDMRGQRKGDDSVERSAADVIHQAVSLLFYEFLFEESLMQALNRQVDGKGETKSENGLRRRRMRQHLVCHEKLLGTICQLDGELSTGRTQLAADVLEVLVHTLFVHVRHSDVDLSELVRIAIGNLTQDNLRRASWMPSVAGDETLSGLKIPPCSPDEAIPPPTCAAPVATTPGAANPKKWVPKSRSSTAPPPPAE